MAKFLLREYFIRYYSYIEGMATFTTLAKFFTEYFRNTNIAGLGEIFILN
jgi:hypothetical protein